MRYASQVDLVSLCVKFQLPSLSRSNLKVCAGVGGGGIQVDTMSNLNLSCMELELGLCFDNNFKGF